MTTYGDVHCMDCGVSMGLDNARAYVPETILSIMPELHALARHVGPIDMALDVEFQHTSLWWIYTHGRHRLAAMDEYGRILATTLGDTGEPRGEL